jgi:hypothetical protein
LVEPPKRRAQIPVRAFIACFRPKHPGDVHAMEWVGLEPQKYDESLDVERQLEELTAMDARKTAQQS